MMRALAADLCGLRARGQRQTAAPICSSRAISPYAGPILAEKLGLRWASQVLSPLSFLSAYDEIDPAAGPVALAAAARWGRASTAPISARRQAGREEAWGSRSPTSVAAWDCRRSAIRSSTTSMRRSSCWRCSRGSSASRDRIGRGRPSSPASRSTTATNRISRRNSRRSSMPGHGRSSSRSARRRSSIRASSSTESARAPRRRRAAGGAARRSVRRTAGPRGADGSASSSYAPFSKLFPEADVIVHQGGSGTTGQAMRAGRPMVVVPYAHDQPDNAMRVSKLGISETIRRGQYSAERVAAALERLTARPDVQSRAAQVGEASSRTRTARPSPPTRSSGSSPGDRGQSVLSTLIGSRREARRAGTSDAAMADAPSIPAIPASTSGSPGCT